MKTKLILVRHGESEGNARRIILGHTDWDLSDLGRKQALIACEALSEQKIDAVYSSDLLRAYNTVAPMAKARGLDVITDEGLREIFLGRWEGKSVSDVIEEDGELFTVEWRGHFGTFTPPEGESVISLGERIAATLAKICEANPGKTLLIGTHAAAIRSFYGRINEIPPERLAETYPFPYNASFTVVEYSDGKFTPIVFSDARHLESDGDARSVKPF